MVKPEPGNEGTTQRILAILHDPGYARSLKGLYRSLDLLPNLLPPIRNESPAHRRERKNALISLAIYKIHELHGPNHLFGEQDDTDFMNLITAGLANLNTDPNNKRWASLAAATADAKTPEQQAFSTAPSQEIATANRKVMEKLKQTRVGWSKTLTRLESEIYHENGIFLQGDEESNSSYYKRLERVIAVAIDRIHEEQGPNYLLDIKKPADMIPPIFAMLKTLDYADIRYERLSRQPPCR